MNMNMKAGSAIITATSTSNIKALAKCTISVTSNQTASAFKNPMSSNTTLKWWMGTNVVWSANYKNYGDTPFAQGHWNSWFNAMIFLRDRELFPLQLVLREILIMNNTDSMSLGTAAGDREMIAETIKYAVIMVATLPVLALYPFLQKYFVKGALIGAVKG